MPLTEIIVGDESSAPRAFCGTADIRERQNVTESTLDGRFGPNQGREEMNVFTVLSRVHR